jgi:hypothetical protein
LAVLALWGLAAIHCQLEALPGLEFFKSCCLAEPAASSASDCESKGCCAVEDGNYRPEEQAAAAPQPILFPALLAATIEAPLPELRICSFVAIPSPPELLKAWQFSQRTARPPRAPSCVV